MRLVIVESPGKIKSISKYLGADYKIMASYGHIRDLKSKNGSVDPEKDFAMIWEMSDRGAKCFNDIKKSLKNCDELLLATDPDREGEAISWHIKEMLEEKTKLKIPCKRIAFHSITKAAIQEAISKPREIDTAMVDAYLARRALDYLVGFTLSPILWRKLPGSRSAGRVQSVALRIIVDREAEIEKFIKQEYWSIDAKFFAPNKKIFNAKLTHFKNKKLDKFSIIDSVNASEIKILLEKNNFAVSNIKTKIVKRNPSPPFITSTLQQEGSRKLGFNAKKTMQVAQKLYEGINVNGDITALITYMRTDSINISQEAINDIRTLIESKYGKKFLPKSARVYSKKVKNAQEAHEAIRPIDVNITPEMIKNTVTIEQYRLYDLIWKRSVASQTESAEFDQMQVDIADDEQNIFRANGNILKFEGFLKIYVEGNDEQNDVLDEEEGMLPPMVIGDNTPVNQIQALQHFTQPPARFSEASLVKKLEELGIGRPSTYATIIQVLQDRGYVKIENKVFFPELRGRVVISFLMNFFKKYLEYDFTANLEQSLDDVSNGTVEKLKILREFWTGLSLNVSETKDLRISQVIDTLNSELGHILFTTNDSKDIVRTCPDCKDGELSLKMGKYGSFVGCSRYPECKYIRSLDSKNAQEDSSELMSSIEYPKFLGVDEKNLEISLRKGPYGLYVQKEPEIVPEVIEISEPKIVSDKSVKEKKKTATKKKKKILSAPKRSSIPSFIKDPENIKLETAIALLQLPRLLGQYYGLDVLVGRGKFGPFILYKEVYYSLKKNPESLFTITLDEAIILIKNSKKK